MLNSKTIIKQCLVILICMYANHNYKSKYLDLNKIYFEKGFRNFVDLTLGLVRGDIQIFLALNQERSVRVSHLHHQLINH